MDQRYRQLPGQSPIELAPEGSPSQQVASLRPQAVSLVQMGPRITASPRVEERFEYPTHQGDRDSGHSENIAIR
jgi:hypothetical protein